MNDRNQMYRNDGHLTDEMLQKMAAGAGKTGEKIQALDHIGGCELCAQRFAACLEQTELLTLPPQFVAGVDKKLSEVRITATPLSIGRSEVRDSGSPFPEPVKGKDKQKEFRRYSCRVAIAACLALLLLFSGTFATGMKMISEGVALRPQSGAVNQLTQKLSDFSKEILQWEVKNND